MKWIPWILILPVVIIRGFTTLYPIIVTLKNSLFDVKVLSGVNKFVGLANYVNVFKDPKVQTSISFTVEFVVVSMVFHVVLGVILKNVITLCIPFTLWRLTAFDLVYAMTSGGPGEDTSLIAYRITTEAFTNLNVGYASTLAVMLFIVMAVFSFINIKFMNKLAD